MGEGQHLGERNTAIGEELSGGNLDHQLETDGYVLLRDVFNPDEISLYRQRCEEIFSLRSGLPGDGDENYVRPVQGHTFRGSSRCLIFTRYADLRSVLFQRKLVASLKKLLGEHYVIFPDGGLQKDNYGGWHKDTNYQEQIGHHWHWRKGYRVVTVVIYLQDNDANCAGGLDVRPGSHKRKLRPNLLQRLTMRLLGTRHEIAPYSIASRGGDVVVFDQRLTHKASHPMNASFQPRQEKFAIFISASRDNKFASLYRSFLNQRPDCQHLVDHEYPADLVSRAEPCSTRWDSAALSFFTENRS